MILLTKDSFVWMDVTERVENGGSGLSETWNFAELYAVDTENDSDYLLTSVDEIMSAVDNGLRVCIEVGHLPK